MEITPAWLSQVPHTSLSSIRKTGATKKLLTFKIGEWKINKYARFKNRIAFPIMMLHFLILTNQEVTIVRTFQVLRIISGETHKTQEAHKTTGL